MRILRRLWGVPGLIFIVSMLVILTYTPAAYGQAVSFSDPIPLTASDGFSWFPDIAVDSSGSLHVAWASSLPGFDSVFYAFSSNGTRWEGLNDVQAVPQVPGQSEATRPTLLAGPDGWLHLSFRGTPVYYSRAPLLRARQAAVWSKPYLMSTVQIGYFSRMALDSRGRLFFVYTENYPEPECSICYHVLIRSSEDSGASWSEPVDISGAGIGSAKPQIIVDKQQNLHVVWESGRGGGLGQLSDPTTVRYATSRDHGKTWSTPYEFSVENSQAEMLKNITIGQDASGRLVAVWWAIPTDDVYYSVSADGGRTWQPPEIIPDVLGAWALYNSRLDTYSIASDSAGNLHLVMVGRRRLALESKLLSVFDLVWDGEKWNSPVTITSMEGDVPEWPRIAVSNGNQLNVVWFVRNRENVFASATGQPRYRIWYARGTAASPAVPGSPVPTLDLPPTPTAEGEIVAKPGVIQPSFTPTPLFDPLPAAKLTPDAVPSSELDYLRLIGVGVAPALLFIILVGIVVAIWKRR